MNNMRLSTIIVIILALIMLVIGILNDEHKSYFSKATMVCTQCIGLG